jgi:nitrogen-specific signal transduction histidine kinase/CheY-like chemotaxis protein
MATIRDISEVKALEEQLAQSQKMEAVGKLAGGVAHDFNNLLTVINGYSEMILNDLSPDAPMRNDLQEILDAGKKARDITRQLLVFARRDTHDPKVFYVSDMINNSEKMLRRLLPENIEIKTILDDQKAPIHADPGQIEQVLVNMIVNARDAMPRGGKVLIELKVLDLDNEFIKAQGWDISTGEYLLLSVTDAGPGIESGVIEHIFEPFFTTKPKGKGTGLGLATSYGIIKRAGGTIKVYSEPGRGSTFKVYLPTTKEKVNFNDMTGTSAPEFKGEETVLLVEDEQSVRILSERILKKNGYQVIVKDNGQAAVDYVLKNAGKRIDLLLTDVIMPDMNGKEVAEKIKVIRTDIKVLYCSGYSQEVIVEQGALERGVHLIQKPYSPFDLAKKVREVLDQDKKNKKGQSKKERP